MLGCDGLLIARGPLPELLPQLVGVPEVASGRRDRRRMQHAGARPPGEGAAGHANDLGGLAGRDQSRVVRHMITVSASFSPNHPLSLVFPYCLTFPFCLFCLMLEA